MKKDILNLFSYEQNLTFTQIKNLLGTRTNLLAYWLKKLTKSGMLSKKNGTYELVESSEHLVPYISENKSALPVILIHLGDRNHAYLQKRTKRPYKGLMGLPGGRLLIGESIKNSAKRIMKVKFGINVYNISLSNIFLEHVKKRGKIIYSFILIIVKAKTENDLDFLNINKNKANIIPSDYKAIKALPEKTRLQTIDSAYK